MTDEEAPKEEMSPKTRLMLADFFGRNEDNAKSRQAWRRVADELRRRGQPNA